MYTEILRGNKFCMKQKGDIIKTAYLFLERLPSFGGDIQQIFWR